MGEKVESTSIPRRNWLIQQFIDDINRAVGLITTNGKSFAKGGAIFFSWFLVTFPVIAFLFLFIRNDEVILSPSFFASFLSGILAVRAANKLGIEEWT